MSTTLQVAGMSCQHCVASVKKSLEAVAGVTLATPNLETGEVKVEGKDVDSSALEKAVIDAGYRLG